MGRDRRRFTLPKTRQSVSAWGAFLSTLAAASLLGCGGAVEGELEAEAETEGAVAAAEDTGGDALATFARGKGASAVASGTKGLVGHWKLDDGSGTDAADATGKNNGTLRYMQDGAWTTGKSGGALQFDGSGYVRVRDSDSLDMRSQVTVAAWIYLTDATGDQNVVQKGDNYALWEIREGGMPQNVLDIGGDQEWETFKFTKDASWFLNAWHHVAFTYDGSQVVNYVDGEQDGDPQPQTGELSTNWDWLGIGTNGAWAEAFFKGKIDDVRVYGKALSAEEIKKIHEEGGK